MRIHAKPFPIGQTVVVLVATLLTFSTATLCLQDSCVAQGRRTKSRTREMWGIQWHRSLAIALKEASRQSDADDGEADDGENVQPILHLRVLGDLTGFM